MIACTRNQSKYINLLKNYRRRKLGLPVPSDSELPAPANQAEADLRTESMLAAEETALMALESALPYQALKQYRIDASKELLVEIKKHNEEFEASRAKNSGTFSMSKWFGKMSSSDEPAKVEVVEHTHGSTTGGVAPPAPPVEKKKKWYSWGSKKKTDERPSEAIVVPPPPPVVVVDNDRASRSSMDDVEVSIEQIEQQIIGDSLDGNAPIGNVYVARFNMNCSAACTVSSPVYYGGVATPVIDAHVNIGAFGDVYTEKMKMKLYIDNFTVRDMHETTRVSKSRMESEQKLLISGLTQSSPPKITIEFDGNAQKSDIRVCADPVVVSWDAGCISALVDIVNDKNSHGDEVREQEVNDTDVFSPAAKARLNKMLMADSATIDMVNRMLGTTVYIEVEAPKVIISYARNGDSDVGYLFLDAGHLLINGEMTPHGGINFNISLLSCCASLWDDYPVLKRLSVEDEHCYVIKPFNIVIVAQNMDKKEAEDLTIDCNISPEIRASLNARKIGDLIRVGNVLEQTFAAESVLPGSAVGNRSSIANVVAGAPKDEMSEMLASQAVAFEKKASKEELLRTLQKFTAYLPELALDIHYRSVCDRSVLQPEDKDYASIVFKDLKIEAMQQQQDMYARFDISQITLFDMHHYTMSKKSLVEQTEKHYIVWTPPTGKSNANASDEVLKKDAVMYPFSVFCRLVKSDISPVFGGYGVEANVDFNRICLELDTYHIKRLKPFWVELSEEMENALAKEKQSPDLNIAPVGSAPDGESAAEAATAALVTRNKSNRGPQAMRFNVNVRDIVVNFIAVKYRPVASRRASRIAASEILSATKKATVTFEDGYSIVLSQLLAQVSVKSENLIIGDVILKSLDIQDKRETSKEFAYRTLFTQLQKSVKEVSGTVKSVQWFDLHPSTYSESGIVTTTEPVEPPAFEYSNIILENISGVVADEGNDVFGESNAVANIVESDEFGFIDMDHTATNKYAVVVSGKLLDGHETSGEIRVNNLTALVSMDSYIDLFALIMENMKAVLEVVNAPNDSVIINPETEAVVSRSIKRRNSLNRGRKESARRASNESIDVDASGRRQFAIKKEKKIPTIQFVVFVKNPCIILLEDCTRADSRCIVAKCDLNAQLTTSVTDPVAIETREMVHVSVIDAEIFALNNAVLDSYSRKRGRSVRIKPRHVIEPMGIELHVVRKVAGGINYSTNLHVDMDGCTGAVSVNDLTLFNNIVAQQKAASEKTEKLSKEVAFLVDEVKQMDLVDSDDDLDEDSDSDDEFASGRNERRKDKESLIRKSIDSMEVPAVKPEQVTLYNIACRLGAIRITAVNDGKGQAAPIIRFGLQHTDFEGSGVATDIEGSVNFTVGVDYYNSRLDVWEPVLEQVHPSAAIKYGSNTMDLNFNIPHAMQVNVSGVMLKSVMETLSLLAQMQEAEADASAASIRFRNANSTGSSYPYAIVNNLGVDVNIVDNSSKMLMLTAFADGIVRDLPTLNAAQALSEKLNEGNGASLVPKNRFASTSSSSLNSLSENIFPTAVDVQFIGSFGNNRSSLQGLRIDMNKRVEYISQTQQKGSAREIGSVRSGVLLHNNALIGVGEPVEEVVYEYNRFNVFTQKWKEPFIMGDPSHWSCENGSIHVSSRDSVPLPSNGLWEWTGPWLCDAAGAAEGKCDKDGWSYGTNFSSFFSNRKSERTHLPLDCCRRRRWLRVRKLKDERQSQSAVNQLASLSKCVISWDVQVLENGTRLINIHSGLQIRNEMPFPISITMQQSAGTRENVYKLENIGVDETVDIPLMYCQHGKIFVQPYVCPKDTESNGGVEGGKETYYWSEMVDCTPVFRSDKISKHLSNKNGYACYRSSTLVCNGSSSEILPIVMRYHLEQSSTGRSVIAVFSPVGVIENKLPCTLNYKISMNGKKDGVTDAGNIAPGAVVPIIHTRDCFNVQCTFQCASYAWSQYAPLYEENRQNKLCVVDMYESNKENLALSLTTMSLLTDIWSYDVSTSSVPPCRGKVNFQIFSSAALVDFTGLCIHAKSKRIVSRPIRASDSGKSQNIEILVDRSSSKLLDSGTALNYCESGVSELILERNKLNSGGRLVTSDNSIGRREEGINVGSGGIHWSEGSCGVSLLHSDDNTVRIGVHGESWSKSLSLKSLSSSLSVFEIKDVNNMTLYQLAYSITNMEGVFYNTRMLTVVPCFRIVNATELVIDLRQVGVSGGSDNDRKSTAASNVITTIPENSTKAWHKWDPSNKTTVLQLRCKSAAYIGGETGGNYDESYSAMIDVESISSDWSYGSVDINAIGSTELLVPAVDGKGNSKPLALHIEVKFSDIKTDQSYLTILIWKCEVVKQTASLSIKNESIQPICIRQYGIDPTTVRKSHSDLSNNFVPNVKAYDICVMPGQWVPFAWANPAAITPHVVHGKKGGGSNAGAEDAVGLQFVLGIGEDFDSAQHKTFPIMEAISESVSTLKLFKGQQICACVQGFGSGRVIRVCNNIDQVKSSISMLSHMGLFQMYVSEAMKGFTYSIKSSINAVDVSFIAERPSRREVLALHLEAFNAYVRQTFTESMVVDFSLGDMQLDTFSETAIHPVMMHTLKEEFVRSGDTEKSGMPLLQINAFRENPVGSVTPVFKYVCVRLMPIHCKVDSGSLQIYLLDLYPDLQYVGGVEAHATEYPGEWIGQTTNRIIQQGTELMQGEIDIEKSMEFARSYKFYFTDLIIHPIKVNLTLLHTTCPRSQSRDEAAASNAAAHKAKEVFEKFDMVGSLAEFEDLDLRVYPFQIQQAMLPIASVTDQYAAQAVSNIQGNLISIFGSYFGGLDIIGRPAGLIKNIHGGVSGLFYEPYQGLMRSGGDGIVRGIGKGASGLVTGVTSGALDSAAGVISSTTKGLSKTASLISGDKEFERTREENRRKQSATGGGVVSGLKDGGRSLVGGFTSGLSGLVTKPMDGAKKEGALGFFKGVGKGIVGVALKPVIGVTDGIVQVTQGISNQLSDTTVRQPLRPPRAFGRSPHDPKQRILIPVNKAAAEAQAFVTKRAKKEKYTDAFCACVPIGNHKYVVLSDVYIFVLAVDTEGRSPVRGGLSLTRSNIVWKSPLCEISHCEYEPNGNGKSAVVQCLMYGGNGISCHSIETADNACGARLYKELFLCAMRFGNPSKFVAPEGMTAVVTSGGDSDSVSGHSINGNDADDISSVGTRDTYGTSKSGSAVATKTDVFGGFQFGVQTNKKVFPVTSMDSKATLKRAKEGFSKIENCLSASSVNSSVWDEIDTVTWRTIFDFEKNHSNFSAARCLAVLIINTSQQPIQINRVEILEGKSYSVVNGVHYDASSQCLLPEKFACTLVFAHGYMPTVVDLAHVKIKIHSSAGEIFVATRKNRSQLTLESGYKGGFLEKSVTDWWAKFVVMYS